MADIEYLSTRQAAVRLGLSLGTVQNMVESGALPAWKTSGGHRRIPVSAVEALLNQRRGGSGTPDSGGPLDLLIAEDDPTLQLLYQMTIEDWHLPVKLRIANNGFDSLLQVGQRVPDLLIADLMMPGMDGFEMIRTLRSKPELARMSIIVVSAMDRAEIEKQGLPSDVTVFGKPIPFHEIKGYLLGNLASRTR